MEEITIDIDERGNVTVEGHGISGPDCKKLTEGIEKALGVATKTELKAEYRQVRSATRTKVV